MARHLPTLLALLAAGCSCGGDDGFVLAVDVRTDLVPGVEFSAIETRVTPEEGAVQRDTITASPADDYFSGRRVAEAGGLSAGVHTVEVTLASPDGTPLTTRRVRVVLEGDYALVVVITRSCLAVTCPGTGDAPTRTECRSGGCVELECSAGALDACGTPACGSDSDCAAAAAACTTARCVTGACLFAPVDGACAADERCHPDLGCVEVSFDAGPPVDADVIRVDARPDAAAGECSGAETRDCYAGDPGLAGTGECRAGTEGCEGGLWGACTGAIGPTAELCNGRDDDCNGSVDDGSFACVPGATNSCTNACGRGGVETCSASCTFGPCAAAERCNSCDDDGDGSIDEGAPCSCTGGTDISSGGTFSGNTCSGLATYDLGCNASGTNEVLYHIPQGTGGAYQMTVSAGFTLSHFMNDVDACRSAVFASPSCNAGSLNFGISTDIGPWVAVERTGGGCGSYTLMVMRTL